MTDDHPELSGYEPHDESRPLRSKRVTTMIRVVVLLGVAALVLPGILTTMQIASTTASNACLAAVARYYPFAEAHASRFEFAGPGGFGWQCYAIDQNEREIFVMPLGIIPAAPGLETRNSPS